MMAGVFDLELNETPNESGNLSSEDDFLETDEQVEVRLWPQDSVTV